MRSQLAWIIGRGRGAQAAIDWVRGTGLTAGDFNAVGAHNVVVMAIEVNDLAFAASWLGGVSDAQIEEGPSLVALRADLALAETLPADERATVMFGLPFDLRDVHPAEDAESIQKRRGAVADLAKLLAVTRGLGLTRVERLLEERLCWLEGLDPATREAARSKIAEGLRSEPARWVRLALRFGVDFDRGELRAGLEKLRGAGGWSADEGGAYLLLEMESGDPGRVARFIDENRKELEQSNFINRLSLVSMEIQALARSGNTVVARAKMEKDVPASDALLVAVIARYEGAVDAVTLARTRFAETDRTEDLLQLCNALHQAGKRDELIGPATDLARRTRMVPDLQAAMGVLSGSGRYADALKLLAEMPTVGVGDRTIEKRRAEAQMRTGDYKGARKTLEEHFGNDIDPYVAHVWVALEIESGQWANLQGLVERALRYKDRLGGLLLIQLAQIAREVGSGHVQDYVDAALAKAGDDAHIYLGAYLIAMERGKEARDPKVQGWFEKAVALSGKDGPIQQKSIRDVAEMAPGWRAHEERISRLLQQGEVPLFIAARSLNVDLVRATLGRAIANRGEPDASRRSLILAFDGSRKETEALKDVNVVAADVSSLLTLGFLGAVDALVRGFAKVVIAPGTLAMLFEERQRVRFYQPSRVARAKRLRKLLDDGMLNVVRLPSLPDELVSEVGEELAGLLVAADGDGGVVVRPGPLHKVGSWMEVAADLGTFAGRVSDTRRVLAYAKAEELLKSEVAAEAGSYIMAADAGMPGAVEIEGARSVYLDDLAVSYLEYTDVLEPFCRKHGRVFIAPASEREVNALIAHDQHAERVLECIEHVRETLARGLAEGTVVVADVDGGGEDEDEFSDAPTVTLLRMTTPVEAVVVDDKFINRYEKWTGRFGEAKVATTLDVLDEATRRKEVTPERLRRLRRDLREAAYALVATDADEFLALLDAATVRDGKLVETSELRILRENALLVMARRALLSREGPWLSRLVTGGMMAVRKIWTEGHDHSEAKSNWVMRALPEHRQFCSTPLNPGTWSDAQRTMAVRVAFLFDGISIPKERRAAYRAWMEKDVLRPLEHRDPEVYAAAIARFKEILRGIVDGFEAQPT